MASPPRQVVIDDTNTQIHYTGPGWFLDQGSQDNVGNFGPTYKKTSHGTKGNDSFSFSFDGSSVTVWGTTSLKQVDNGTSFDPRWQCFVDGISIGATKPFQFAENNWSLCEQGTMADGPHVITVNVTTTGNTFWFDYLTFTPSPGNSSATLLVQNADSAILYDDSWQNLGGTANMTTRIGSVVNFDFVGTGLTWVGFIPTELPHNESTASYSIDNGPLTRFKLAGLPPTATTTVYNQVFFTTPDLPIGHHAVMVTYEGSNAPSTPLTLDYLLVTDAPLPVAANTNSSGSAVATAGATVTTSPAPIPSPTSHPNTPIGPIVGGVVGGLTIIAILLFALWWWRRRRALHMRSNIGFTGAGYGPSHLRTVQTQMAPYTTAPVIQRLQAEPFTLTDPFSDGPQPSPNLYSRSDLSYAPRSALPENDRNNRSYDVNQRMSQTDTYTTSVDTSDVSGYEAGTVDQIRAGRKYRPVESIITPVVHQDSGMRLPPSQNLNIIVEDVPPMYTTN